MVIERYCCLIAAVAIFLVVSTGEAATRRRRRHGSGRLPMPTKETLPYVAEVLGAASFEENPEDNGATDGGGSAKEPIEEESRRVQRKLPADSETSGLDSVPYMEYQGVMGRPGVDFPVLATIPRTDFSCRSVKQSGYYADLHTGCQVFHICDGGRKISFLCPNGTIFRQTHLICDWWFRVDCGKSKEQYEESAELLAHDQMVYKKRAEEIAKAMQQGESKSHEERLESPKPVASQTPTTPRARSSQPRRKQSRVSSFTKYNVSDETESERQEPAETASFVGNQRHRFGNNIGESVHRNAYAGDSLKFTTTPSPSSLAVQQSTTAKPVFTIRVKPNREFSFVELHKQDAKKGVREDRRQSFQSNPYPNVQFVTSRPMEVTSDYSYTHTPSPSRIQYSSVKTSKFNSLSMNTKHSFSSGYSKNNIDYSLATTQLPPFYSKNRTNEIDFIRPEVINSLMETEPTPSYVKFGTPTPASAVNTLHSLASYYESAAADIQKELVSRDVENNSKPPVSEILLRAHSGSPESGEFVEQFTTPRTETTNRYTETVLPSVLTKATHESYSYLFRHEAKPKEKNVKFISSNAEVTSESKDIDVNEKIPDKLLIDNAINEREVTIKDHSKEIQSQKESADLRELAQVFTRALSAYLEDPESFKEILAQVRPSEPSTVDSTTPSQEDEVLAFSDDSKNMNLKPHALPFTATTMRPFTPNDINNFIAAVTNIEADNSLDHSSSGASGSVEQLETVRFLTTIAPTSIAQDVNSIAVNGSLNNIASGEYYSPLVSAEDNSYFPTAGGVTDGTRPRYGGFQNNTGDIYINKRKYSRYGTDLPPNITGAPLSVGPTTLTPVTVPFTTIPKKNTEGELYQKIPEKLNLPDAYDVNNLATNNFFTDSSSKFSSEEPYSNHKKEDPLLQNEQNFYNNGGEEEKLLIASGTQSLFSANNYFNYNEKESNDQKRVINNVYPSLYSPFSYNSQEASSAPVDSSLRFEEQQFSQDHDNIPDSDGTTFPTTTVIGDYFNVEQTTFSPQLHQGKQSDDFSGNAGEFSTVDPTYEQFTTDFYNHDSFETQERKLPVEPYKFQNVNLGNGVTLERVLKYTKPSDVTWSVPTATERPVDDSSDESRGEILPTTYHPQHKTEQVITTQNPFYIPAEPQLEQKAKEMFGSLNETATGKLMSMVDKAESNTTIRKLVLLLVADSNRENLTVEESRSNLIRELLVNGRSDSSSESLENSKDGNSLGTGSNDGSKPPSTGCSGERQIGRMESSAAHSDRYHMQIGRPCVENQDSVANQNGNAQATTVRPQVETSRMEYSVSTSTGQRGDKEKISSKYRSGKNYRGTDSQTAVVGSSLQTTELNNRINSAKLFIPSTPDKKIPSTDARAVELLKSLYNLAAKWG